MSKRYKVPPVDLADYKAKKAEEGAIPIRANGSTFYVRPVECLTDDEYFSYSKAKGDDIVGQARIMIDDYDGFVAAGGSAMLLLSIVKDHVERVAAEQGVDPGESPASSDS